MSWSRFSDLSYDSSEFVEASKFLYMNKTPSNRGSYMSDHSFNEFYKFHMNSPRV